MADTFKPGDVVVLKSGSPKMTVTKTYQELAYCLFYDFNAFAMVHENQIPMAALKFASSDEFPL